MKSTLLAIIVLTGSAFAEMEPHSLVVEGLNAYQRNGGKAGLAVWTRGSAIQNDELKGGSADGFDQIEKSYGKMIGFEVIRVVPIAESMQRVYILLKYERGPAYASFDCYLSSNVWIIPMMNYSVRPSAILPNSILSGSNR